MATGDITFFGKFKKAQLDGSTLGGCPVDFDSDTIKYALLTSEPDTGDSSTDEHWDDVSGDQVVIGSGTEYTVPRTLTFNTMTLSGGTVSVDYQDDTINQDGNGFTGATWIVIFKDTGTPATSPLICKGELGTARSNVSGSLTLSWHANGLFQLS